jgi:hypothetical protein
MWKVAHIFYAPIAPMDVLVGSQPFGSAGHEWLADELGRTNDS